MLYLSWAYGNLQNLVGMAVGNDDMKALKALSARMEAANQAMLSWIRSSKGEILVNLGSGGIVAVEPEKAIGVAGLVDRLSEYFGTTMHVGLGLTADEAWQALSQASEQGIPYMLFDPEAEAESSKSSSKSLSKSSSKAEGDIDAFEDPGFDARHFMREALQNIKAQAPAFEQLKASQPEAYKALQRVIAAMVLMGHEIAAMQAVSPEDVQKAEDEVYKQLGLPKPKKGLRQVSKVKVKYSTPEAVVGSLSGPVNLDMRRKSTTVDQQTGEPDKTKFHSLRSGQVIGKKGGIVPSRQPDQD